MLAKRSFQSTPAITDGRRAGLLYSDSVKRKFQSTPAITDGRRDHQLQGRRGPASFNPRPPSLTGDAVGVLHGRLA